MQQSVIFDIKKFWSYRDYHIACIFRNALSDNNRGIDIPAGGYLPHAAAIPGNGGAYFDWRLDTVEAVILKQVCSDILGLNRVADIWHRFGESFSPLIPIGVYGPTERSYLHLLSRRDTMLVFQAQPIS